MSETPSRPRKYNSRFTGIRTSINYAQSAVKEGNTQRALERLDGAIQDAADLREVIVADAAAREQAYVELAQRIDQVP